MNQKHGRVFESAHAQSRLQSAAGWLVLWLVFALMGTASAKSKKARETKLSAARTEEFIYRGMCDASAAVALGTNFVAVASDEDSRLRVYHRGGGGLPLLTFNLAPHLALDRSSPETDLEGAARLGDRVYWITSHSRNNDGKARPSRHRFFATTFSESNGRVVMEFTGQPYRNLVTDLASAPQLQRWRLGMAASLAPKDAGGLNIEGLCATPDGQLLIGFRSPAPQGRALLVPLKNPADVVAGGVAQFGEPILLDLGGLGVRDLAFHAGSYAIVAGGVDGRGQARLFRWAGGDARPEVFRHLKLNDLNPEAVVIYPDTGWSEVQLFSDDSSRAVGGKNCADVKDETLRQFRGVRIGNENLAPSSGAR